MGQFNEILNARFNNLLRAFLPVDEQEGAQTLSPEIGASIQIESDRVDWLYLKKEKICGGAGTATPSVGVLSHVSLRNPAGSNVLATVSRIFVRPFAPLGNILWGIMDLGGVPFAASLAPQVLDPRWQSTPAVAVRPTCAIFQGTTGVSVPGAAFYYIATDVTVSIDLDVVLSPGQSMFVIGTLANTSLSVTFQWRERGAMIGELV